MITANESIPTVVRAIRLGAYDSLVKPLVPEQLEYALSRALERRSLVEALRLRAERDPHPALGNPDALKAIVSEDSHVQRLLRGAELHATSDVPMLITGADRDRAGLLAQANGDTLFLDEIGDLPLETVERRHLLATYQRLSRNKSQTAGALEIGLQTLHRKLKAYGVD